MANLNVFHTLSVLLVLFVHFFYDIAGSYKLFSGERINTATNSGVNSAYTITAPTATVKYAPMNSNGLAPASMESGKINLSAYDNTYGATAAAVGSGSSGGGYGSTATAYSAPTSNVPPPGMYCSWFGIDFSIHYLCVPNT